MVSDHTIMVIWVIKIFFYSSSVYSCHLFLISSASVRSILFLSFIVPIFAWNVSLVSLIFLKRSLVFHILLFSSVFFALITEDGFLISPCYSLELCIQIGISFLFYFAFSFSSPMPLMWLGEGGHGARTPLQKSPMTQTRPQSEMRQISSSTSVPPVDGNQALPCFSSFGLSIICSWGWKKLNNLYKVTQLLNS